MNFLRGAASFLCLYSMGLCLFLAANLFALFTVVNADNLKATLREQETYGKIVPAVLSTASYSAPAVGQLPLGEPWVQEAAVKAFPTSDLEQKGDMAINSSFAWLEGETEKPNFRLDFTSNKQALADEIGKSAESRLAGLPQCALGDIPTSVDTFKATCLPFGVSPSLLADEARTQIIGDQGFLKDPVISSDNLSVDVQLDKVDSTASSQDPFERLDGLRWFFEHKSLLLWILPIMAVLSGVGVFLLAPDHRAAMRKMSRTLFMNGLALLAFGLFIGYGLRKIIEATSRDQLTRDVLLPVITSLTGQAQAIYMVFVVIALTLAGGLFFGQRRLRQNVNPPVGR